MEMRVRNDRCALGKPRTLDKRQLLVVSDICVFIHQCLRQNGMGGKVLQVECLLRKRKMQQSTKPPDPAFLETENLARLLHHCIVNVESTGF